MLPLFPLKTVVFPNENLNLHVFEPRYQQLVEDCIQHDRTFGIPAFFNKKVQEYGTEMRIIEIVKKYPDNRMDIRILAERIFRIDSFSNPMPDKLHAGGQVTFLETIDDTFVGQRLEVKEKVFELYGILGLEIKIEVEEDFLSYRLGHQIGLSQEQELELLILLTESQRLDYLVQHLKKSIPVVREMERTKERIRMNGHFRNFKPPLNF